MDDLVVVEDHNNKAMITVHLADADGFSYCTFKQISAGFWPEQKWLSGDFNGDGKDDLVNVYKGLEGKATAWVHLSTGSGFKYQSSFQRFKGFWKSQRWIAGDFNGDGLDDLVNLYGTSW